MTTKQERQRALEFFAACPTGCALAAAEIHGITLTIVEKLWNQHLIQVRTETMATPKDQKIYRVYITEAGMIAAQRGQR